MAVNAPKAIVSAGAVLVGGIVSLAGQLVAGNGGVLLYDTLSLLRDPCVDKFQLAFGGIHNWIRQQNQLAAQGRSIEAAVNLSDAMGSFVVNSIAEPLLAEMVIAGVIRVAGGFIDTAADGISAIAQLRKRGRALDRASDAFEMASSAGRAARAEALAQGATAEAAARAERFARWNVLKEADRAAYVARAEALAQGATAEAAAGAERFARWNVLKEADRAAYLAHSYADDWVEAIRHDELLRMLQTGVKQMPDGRTVRLGDDALRWARWTLEREARIDRALVAGKSGVLFGNAPKPPSLGDAVSRHVKETLTKLFGPQSAATTAERMALVEFAKANELEIAIRATDPLTARVTRILNRLGLPGKPEWVKDKSVYGLVSAERPDYLPNLGKDGHRYFRSDLDIAWVIDKTTGQPLTSKQVWEKVIDPLNRIMMTRGQKHGSFYHGPHYNMYPEMGGYMSRRQIATVGDPGAVNIFSGDGMATLTKIEAQRYAINTPGLRQGGGWKDWIAQESRALSQELGRPVPADYSMPDVKFVPVRLTAGSVSGSFGSGEALFASRSLVTLADTAQSIWQQALGVSVPLQLTVSIADLPAGELARAYITQLDTEGVPLEGRLVVDWSADGHGWFIDPTPLDASEFGASGSPADGRYDLFSVVAHEVGHVLGMAIGYEGYERYLERRDDGRLYFVVDGVTVVLSEDGSHLDGLIFGDDLMSSTLQASERRLPSVLGAWIVNAARESVTTTPQPTTVEIGSVTALVELRDRFTNGDFTISDTGAAEFGWSALGSASAMDGRGVLTENATLASRLMQTVLVPQGATAIRFTLVDALFDAPGAGPPDAFEVALLGPTMPTPLAGSITLSNTDALLNVQADGTVYAATGVTVPGAQGGQLPASLSAPIVITVDLAGASAGDAISLYFDLVGFGSHGSRVVIDDVRFVLPGESNAAPVAIADAASLEEDSSVPVDVLANDTDADGDGLMLTAVGTPTHGAATIEDGKVRYTPVANYFGSDRLTYTVMDSVGNLATGTLELTVASVNDAPTLQPLPNVQRVEGAVLTVAAVGADPDGDALKYQLDAAPPGATIDANTGAILWTASGAGTTVTFAVSVSDGQALASRSFSVEVLESAPPNAAPGAQADQATVAEDSSVLVDVLANDTDPDGDTIRLTGVGTGQYGTAVIEGGRVRYTPAANYNGPDTVSYAVTDTVGNVATGMIDVVVTPVNDAPTLPPLTDATIQAGSTLRLTAQGGDIDGDVLTYDLDASPAGATIDTATGVISWLGSGPGTTVSFTVSVTDGQAAAFSSFSVQVVPQAPTNKAPQALADTAGVGEDASVLVPVLANDTDADGDPLAIISVGSPSHGAVAIEQGAVRYTPASNYFGTDSFTYVIDDGHGGRSTGTVQLTIAPVNDAPVTAADAATVAEDSAVLIDVLANDVDIDDGRAALTLRISQPPSHGMATVQNGQIRYTPAANYNGTDRFEYQMVDAAGAISTSEVNLTVTPVNDAPTLAPIADTVVRPRFGFTTTAVGSDVDGDTLRYSLVSGPSGASIDPATGRLTWRTPMRGVTAEFVVRVTDGTSSASRDFSVTVVAEPRQEFRLGVPRPGSKLVSGTPETEDQQRHPRLPVLEFETSPMLVAMPQAPVMVETTGRPVRSVRPDGQATALDANAPAGRDPRLLLWVERFVPALNGFVVRFSQPIETPRQARAESTTTDALEILVLGADGKPVAGTVVMDADGKGFRFVPQVEPMQPGTYQVILRSGTDGIHSFFGVLDGNRDGVPGDDYRQTLRVPAAQGASLRLEVPALDATAHGKPLALPLTLHSAGDVRQLSFAVKLDPRLYEVHGVAMSSQLPAGAQLTLSHGEDGICRLSLLSPINLPAGILRLGCIEVSQKTDDPPPDRIDAQGGDVVIDLAAGFGGFALAGALAYARASRDRKPQRDWRTQWLSRRRAEDGDPNGPPSIRISLDE